MTNKCELVVQQFRSEIDEIVRAQRDESREAIFFIYEDGRTSNVYKGEATSISISRDEEKRIQRQGNIIASVHTHPTGFDPSTIDIMTGVTTNQKFMCIATPSSIPKDDKDFVMTCIDLSGMGDIEKQRLLRAMRRATVGITDIGRFLRKQTSIKRFNISGCRSHDVHQGDREATMTKT